MSRALALTVFIAASVSAEPGNASRFVVSSWGVSDGLPQTSVTALAQDERGFLWVATFGGLARFDGRTFVRIDPPHTDLDGHRFVSVACTGSTVWAGTDHGRLFRFDDWGMRAPVEVLLGDKPADPLWQLQPRGGQLLVAAGQGGVLAVDLQSSSVTRLDSPATPAQMVTFDAQQRLWIAGDGRLSCLGVTALDFTVRDPSSLWTSGDSIHISGRDGHFTVRDGKLVKLDARGGVVFQDRTGRTWSSDARGVVLELAEGEALQHIPVSTRRTEGPSVRAFLLDGTDCLWVATDDSGLFRVRDRHVTTLADGAGLVGSSTLLVLPLDDGGALISTYCHGLQRLSAPPELKLTRVPGIDDDACILALTSDGIGGAWLAVARTLQHFDGTTLREVAISPPLEAQVRSIVIDADKLWLGTGLGLLRLEHEGDALKIVTRISREQGLAHESVFSLAREPSGALIVGTLRGAARVSLTGVVSPLIRTADERPAVVRDILIDGDVAWLATYGEGLARVDLKTSATKWLATNTGFCTDALSRVMRVGDDVWLNGNQGIVVVPRADLEALARGEKRLRCRFLESGEGNGGGQPAGSMLRGGLLAMPTVDGIAIIDPSAMRKTFPTPPLFIEEATVDGTPILPGTSVTIPPGRRDFLVKLMTPPGDDGAESEPDDITSTLTRNGIDVREHLGGLEATWVGLPPGDYVFRAWRQGPTGPGSATELQFTLARSISETRFARIGVPFLILALMGLVLRSYIATVRGRARALEAQLDEREQAERARRERDELYRTVFDGSPMPLLLFGKNGALRELNPAAKQWVELAGLPLPVEGAPFVAEGERAAFLAFLKSATSHPSRLELSMRSGDGLRRVSAEAATLSWLGEEHTLVAATDVTAARDAEQQRAELLERNASAQRLEGLGRLAAGVAHDFNNVLAALQLQLEDLRSRPGDVKAVRELASEMEDAVRTGKDLTSRFLVFGKGDTDPAVFTLDTAVEEARRLLTRLLPAHVEFIVECHAHDAKVRLPRVHLERVLLNLVLNARDALRSEGRIVVRTRLAGVGIPTRANSMQVIGAPSVPWVSLDVEDNGVGMSAETMKRAFEPFFTTRDPTQGTGLGLTVVHGIALRAGAGLSVASEEGHGTCFTLQWPLSTDAQTVTQTAPQPKPTTKAPTVLVCDDTALLRKSLARLFRGIGWTVLEAGDGREGLVTLERAHVDLLITDLKMPELDGVEVITALHARGATLPIILLSGYTADAHDRLGPTLRARIRTMDKPFVPDELLALARSLVPSTA